jgi:hypothetical protein
VIQPQRPATQIGSFTSDRSPGGFVMPKRPIALRAARIQVLLVLSLASSYVGSIAAASDAERSADVDSVSRTRHYLRGAYQLGRVLPSNDFVKGKNKRGEPIDSFHSARIEFGWQTDGCRDWHHLYNFPSYGIGLYGADYFNEEELGKPTSLYGFFVWPVHRWSSGSFNVELAFGLTDNWVSFDPVENPYNVAIGAARSVHIDVGANVELPLAHHWSVLLGVSGTHFSNGGSQQPNYGINQIGPLVFAKYHFAERFRPPPRRILTPYEPRWELALTFAAGVRNLSAEIEDEEQQKAFLDKDYFIGNIMATLSRQLSYMARFGAGLDFTYDETVGDLVVLEGLKQGRNASASFGDKLDFAAYGGYEHVANHTHLLIQLGYTLLRKEVDGRLPRFYQRLGIKHHVFRDWYIGLNVRFHEFSKADNLEWNVGRRFWLD